MPVPYNQACEPFLLLSLSACIVGPMAVPRTWYTCRTEIHLPWTGAACPGLPVYAGGWTESGPAWDFIERSCLGIGHCSVGFLLVIM